MNILVTDIDGTLLQEDTKKMTKKDFSSLKEFQKSGLVIANTGRNLKLMQEFVNDNNFYFDYYLLCNGSIILNNQFELIYHKPLEKAVISKLIAQDQFSFRMDTIDSYLAQSDYFHPQTKVLDAVKLIKLFEYNTFDGYVLSINITKMDCESRTELFEFLDCFSEFCEYAINVDDVDITAIGNNKATIISKLVELKGLHTTKIFTIGDSFNDFSMLEAFCGATFLDSDQEIKNITKYIVSDVAEFCEIIEAKK